MNQIEWEKFLVDMFQSPLRDLGFLHKKPLSFIRGTNERLEIITFGGRIEREYFMFGCSAGLRFPSVEKLMRPSVGDNTYPTINVPTHLLHDDRQFFEWSMENIGPNEITKNQVNTEIREYVLPFFQKFSDLHAVKASLQSKEPNDWFVLTPEQRICLMAAIEKISGNPKQALEIIDNALAERRDALPKKRRMLENLRTQLTTT